MYDDFKMTYCPFMQYMYMAPRMMNYPGMGCRMPSPYLDNYMNFRSIEDFEVDERGIPNKAKENTKININENITKPINENITKPINENITKPINENITKPINENITKPINENITKPINENITKPSNKSVKVNEKTPPQKHGHKINFDSIEIDIILNKIQAENPIVIKKLVNSGVPHHIAIDIIKNIIYLTLKHRTY